MDNLKPFKDGEDDRRKNSGRKSTKFLTDLLIKELRQKDEIIIEGYDIVTGAKTKVRVPMPTQRQIVQALLRQANKGNVNAIREVYDRVEGKTPQGISFQDRDGNDVPLRLVFQPATNNDPIGNG